VLDSHAAPDVPWAVAIPGPFDYRRGIGLFNGVGKLDALLDVNLAARLHAALPHLTDDITLDCGVGSSFLDNGVPVTSGPIVPPHGRAHRLKIGNADLQDVVSRRAILAGYLAGPGVTGLNAIKIRLRARPRSRQTRR
jgi:glucokinase